MEEATPGTGSRKTAGLILIVVATAIVSGSLGYWLANANIPDNVAPAKNVGIDITPKEAGPSSIITSQSATAVGKVVKVEAGGVTLQADDGKIVGFKLASTYQVYNTASSSGKPKTSQDVKDVVLNKKYVLNLNLQDGDYVINTISQVPQ